MNWNETTEREYVSECGRYMISALPDHFRLIDSKRNTYRRFPSKEAAMVFAEWYALNEELP